MSDSHQHKEQEGLVSKLRENVQDIWQPYFAEDNYMAKWLKARDYDLKKAELMLRAHIIWRENEKIDTILSDFTIPDVYEKYGFGGYCGNDKEGHPVWYDAFGRADPQGLMKSITKNDLIKTRINFIEQLFKHTFPKRSEEEGRAISQIIAMFDLEGFSRKLLWRPVMDCIIEVLKIMEANYPEYMHKIFIFNAPPIFKIAFNIVKPFLHQATKSKITFLGKNFKEDLLEIIDRDQLPAVYGGNMYGPDNDPMCRHLIRWGGEVPHCYYFTEHQQEMVTITVGPRSKVKLLYSINQLDSVLYYEFSTKCHDVNFGVYFIGDKITGDVDKIKSSGLERILSLERTHANLMIQKGELGSLRTGYYLIEFDNSYSWATSKVVQYHIEVLDVVK